MDINRRRELAPATRHSMEPWLNLSATYTSMCTSKTIFSFHVRSRWSRNINANIDSNDRPRNWPSGNSEQFRGHSGPGGSAFAIANLIHCSGPLLHAASRDFFGGLEPSCDQ